MHYTFFHIPAIDPDAAAKRFNAFIQSQSVIGIERQFVADGLNSFWSICVTTAPPGGSGLSDLSAAKKRTRIDYREVLSPEAFAIFARLRTLRNTLAEEKGMPAYAIFTNDQFFPNIDHEILHGQLRRRFRGDGMALLDAVIAAHGSEFGKGLPIGALTSQHFANHYLSQADRWCLSQPGIDAHCRYMDDFLLWANDRKALQACADGISRVLDERLGLEIKPVTIRRTDGGILFCGVHIWPFRLRPSQRRRKRYRLALAHWQQQWLTGAIDSLELQQAYAACRAILLPADDLAWRKHCLTRIERVDA